MRQKAHDFWTNYVLPVVAPDPTTIADTLSLWPQDDGKAIEATEQMESAVVTLDAIKGSRMSYERGEEGVGLLIREYMKTAQSLVVDGIELATLKTQNTASINTDKLKTEFPDAYKACRRISTTRVLRLTKQKD